MIRTQRIAVAAIATAGLALSAACTGSGGGTAAPVPAATGAAVSAQPTSLGTVLVDGRGRTVYVFANDTTSTSTCTGACAGNWPPVPAPSPLPASLPGVDGAAGTTARPEGTSQLTVAGHPVYTFSGDSAPGQTNGQGINLDGGVWTVVSPSGTPIAHPTGTTAPRPGSGY